jgi:hypothetical protein
MPFLISPVSIAVPRPEPIAPMTSGLDRNDPAAPRTPALASPEPRKLRRRGKAMVVSRVYAVVIPNYATNS